MNLPRVAVIDYGLCNIDSVVRAVDECGGRPFVTFRPEEIGGATHIILPGVGAFCDAMKNLHERSLVKVLTECTMERKVPFLGICLGMQLLADKGWEGGETAGLGWIPGEVRRLVPSSPMERIPHVGWNGVQQCLPSPLWEGIPSEKDFYFVHSFCFCPADEADVIGRTPYCGTFVSAVARGNVFGTQFHPEKSQRAGFRLLKNFLALAPSTPC